MGSPTPMKYLPSGLSSTSPARPLKYSVLSTAIRFMSMTSQAYSLDPWGRQACSTIARSPGSLEILRGPQETTISVMISPVLGFSTRIILEGVLIPFCSMHTNRLPFEATSKSSINSLSAATRCMPTTSFWSRSTTATHPSMYAKAYPAC